MFSFYICIYIYLLYIKYVLYIYILHLDINSIIFQILQILEMLRISLSSNAQTIKRDTNFLWAERVEAPFNTLAEINLLTYL